MHLRKHAKLLGIVSIAWLLFLVAGRPDYYQQYSFRFMLVFDLAILPPIWYIVYRSIKRTKTGREYIIALWWSFYISCPLFIYDAVYCGLILGFGVSFLWKFWYLSIYYFIPWIIFPPTAFWVARIKRMTSD